MAEGRQTEAWNHTAAILAWIGNNNPHRKSKTFHPRDFHPFARRSSEKEPPPIKADISILKRVFVDRS